MEPLLNTGGEYHTLSFKKTGNLTRPRPPAFRSDGHATSLPAITPPPSLPGVPVLFRYESERALCEYPAKMGIHGHGHEALGNEE